VLPSLPNAAGNSSGIPPEAALLFAALGDETRLGLVSRLSGDGPMSITRLTSGTTITRQAITKHLRVLEEAHLVSSTKRGREIIWELEQKRLEEASYYLGVISKQWDDALGRLKAFVEQVP
jgi:DNA-binding transcriptional ArsR family regulator